MKSRILGLDLARGLALAGMVVAHVGDDVFADGDGWTWLWIADGRSSALFAVLAGVTISIMIAGAGGRDDARAVRFTRARVATRAAILVVLGLLLAALGTPVDVILVSLGLMMVLALPALRWPSWALLAAAGLAIAFGRALLSLASPSGEWATAPLVGRLWGEHYPALVWVAYVLIGMAIGRLPLRSPANQARLLGLGLIAAAGASLISLVGGDGPVTSIAPHSYTPVEMAHNAGVAAAVIGLCCWLAPRVAAAISPLTALGSMTLTAYVLHVLVIAIVGPEMAFAPSNTAMVVLLVSLIAIAWAWRRWLGQGPLERILTRVSNAVGERAVRDLPARRGAGA